LDTQSDSSGALDTNQAGALFASILDPQSVEADKKEPEATADKAVETTAEDAQANPDATEETPSGDNDPEVTVKIDGKDVTVKLSELKGSYQKDKAAQQRFEQAAELRKQADAAAQKAEAETKQAQAERQAYQQKLQGIHAQLGAALQQQQQIDWDALKAADPVEFVNQVRLAQERQALYQRTTAELQTVQAQNQADQQKALAAHIAKQQEELLAKLPEWKDEAKAKTERAAIREYLVGQGFGENDVDGISDARAVVMARKAMLYDQIMSKADAATKKVATLPQKVERPGVGEAQHLDKRSSAYQRLAKSGRVEDAANLFAQIL